MRTDDRDSQQGKSRFSETIRRLMPLTAVLIGLWLLFSLTQWMAQRFQTPGHMDVLDAQTMEMTVHPPAGAMPVEMETLRTVPFASSVTYPGNVVAWNDIAVYPRTEGRIVSMPVYPGDAVRAGDVLAQLDARELTARLDEALAGRNAAGRQAEASGYLQKQAAFQEDRAVQVVRAAKADLAYRQEQIRRSRNLAQDEVITREEAQRDESEFANAEARYREALSDLQAARQARRAAASQSRAQRSQVLQSDATVRTQRLIQSYARITAPFDGYITQRLAGPGTVAGPGMAILRMARLEPLRVQANVATQDLGHIRKGNPATIQLREKTAGKPIVGKVSAIFPQIDPQTRTGIVEVRIDRPSGRLLPGDFVDVSIRTGIRADAIAVPNAALTERGEQRSVWVVSDDGGAHRRFVTTGDTDGVRTLVADGLHAGETVIVRGYEHLADGNRVTRAKYGRWGPEALPDSGGAQRLSQANDYRIRRAIGMYDMVVRLEGSPRVGGNILFVEMASMPGMRMPLAGLAVEMRAEMPAMAGMPVSKPSVQKIGDGHFRTDVAFGMPGLWRIDIDLKDGGRTLGVFPVEVEVAAP